jgi:uncharacterized protein YlxW (UPF0749 family)
MTDTTRPTVERTLRLAVTNRHITPAIERLALAILDRAETAEAATREYAMEALTSLGQASDAHDAQLKAEAERDALQAEVARLRGALRECEAEIDQYIRQEYPSDHPIHDRYRKRDFAANPARIALEANT